MLIEKDEGSMTLQDMQMIANIHNLGNIEVIEKVAKNTGKRMMVGYVYIGGDWQLFCKYSSIEGSYYLCNQFRELKVNGLSS